MSGVGLLMPASGAMITAARPDAPELRPPPLLELSGISRSFHGVQALREVDFSLHRGEVVSLVGQNGAGKSTLVSIIGGIYAPEAGEIRIDGEVVRIASPAVAEQLGIGLVHQEPTLVPNMSIAANVFLNRERLRAGVLLDFRRMNEETARILGTLGFSLDPGRLVEDLRLVEKEAVEIAKAMLPGPRILILDEVTAPLNAAEVERLFRLVRELKASGIGVIFISHRLTEVAQLSDRIVVLRDGRHAGELRGDEHPAEKDIIRLMLGGSDLRAQAAATSVAFHPDRKLSVRRLAFGDLFSEVDMDVHAGEVVGLAGLKGSGISEMMKCIYGALQPTGGEVSVNGHPVSIRSPAQAIRNGIGMVTNDRQKEGLALPRSVEENISVSALDALSNRLRFFRLRKLANAASRLVQALEIKTSSLTQDVRDLSGGNQQKVVIAKWLLRNPGFILVDEPTRGVDVKAQAEIHRLLVGLKQEGKGLLVASPEVPELLSMCDRILIVSSGRITAEIRRGTADFAEAPILELLHARGR